MSGSRGRLGVAAVSILAVLAAAGPTWSMPGGGGGAGGGGMNSMPSQTGPAYDPAEEYRKGVEALQQGEFRDAARAFERVTDAAPDYADGHYLLGLARQGEDKLRPARRAFQTALRKDENHIGARAQLGVTLAKMGESEDAQEQLGVLKTRADACAQTCPEAADLAAAVSAVEAAIGQGPQAALEAPRGLELASAEAGDAAYVDAVALINDGRYEDAIVTLRAAEQAFGPHPDVLTYLGFANRKLGRYEDAERYYGLALAAAPEHRGATEYLGELRVEQGDLEEAGRLLARLDAMCDFGCAEADELRRWIAEAS
jgi:tetratricopeptide (TPR) repeat protein